MGWSSTDISQISIEQREVLTPFNCWAPVMCWKTLSISCSMRLAQCIILWRHITACHNTCKRTCRDDARFVVSCHRHLSEDKIFSLGSADTNPWHMLTQNLLAGHRHNYIHLPGYVFWLSWNCWLVCLCSNCWMSFKLKLGGDCWKALAGVSTGVIPVEEYLQSRKKKNIFGPLFIYTVYFWKLGKAIVRNCRTVLNRNRRYLLPLLVKYLITSGVLN